MVGGREGCGGLGACGGEARRAGWVWVWAWAGTRAHTLFRTLYWLVLGDALQPPQKFNAWLDRMLDVDSPQNSLMVYPEGTRSLRQQSLPLKRGEAAPRHSAGGTRQVVAVWQRRLGQARRLARLARLPAPTHRLHPPAPGATTPYRQACCATPSLASCRCRCAAALLPARLPAPGGGTHSARALARPLRHAVELGPPISCVLNSFAVLPRHACSAC